MNSKVLFLCTGNSCRSQMAEGFLRHLAGGGFEAHSAGTRPSEVNPGAIAVMQEKGIDISRYRSKNVAEYLDQSFSHVITVCDNAKELCPIFPGTSIHLHWSLPDPAEAKGTHEARLAVFRLVRDDIESRIRSFLADPPRS